MRWVTCRDEVLDATHALTVRSGGRPFSPAQVVAEVLRAGSRYPESTIRTHVVAHMSGSRGLLRRVDRGLYVLTEDLDDSPVRAAPSAAPQVQSGHGRAQAWPWEGAVQAVFVAYLSSHGWTVTATADTASKSHGVDVLATQGQRYLGAEVKGWPSTGYADPRRGPEVKRTQPTNQAGHWFAQALLMAVMLLDTHPRRESIVVLPDMPRYQDLASRTRTGRAAAGVHVVLLDPDGQARSDTWSP